MRHWIYGIAFIALLAPGVATAQWAPDALPDIPDAQKAPGERLIGGQPEPHHLVQASEAGVRHVVNVRDRGEFDDWDVEALVEELGMTYHRAPVGGPADLDAARVEAFDGALEEIGQEPALIYCASGNRVGSLFALRAGWIQGDELEEAVDHGRSHGLTGLEDSVRDLLEEGS